MLIVVTINYNVKNVFIYTYHMNPNRDILYLYIDTYMCVCMYLLMGEIMDIDLDIFPFLHWFARFQQHRYFSLWVKRRMPLCDRKIGIIFRGFGPHTRVFSVPSQVGRLFWGGPK